METLDIPPEVCTDSHKERSNDHLIESPKRVHQEIHETLQTEIKAECKVDSLVNDQNSTSEIACKTKKMVEIIELKPGEEKANNTCKDINKKIGGSDHGLIHYGHVSDGQKRNKSNPVVTAELDNKDKVFPDIDQKNETQVEKQEQCVKGAVQKDIESAINDREKVCESSETQGSDGIRVYGDCKGWGHSAVDMNKAESLKSRMRPKIYHGSDQSISHDGLTNGTDRTLHEASQDRKTPECLHSDSDNETQRGIELVCRDGTDSQSDLMKFAEVLYKCTLCTSIPSILTSKSSFLQHVSEQHLMKDHSFQLCKFCSLKFRTDEDLKEHVLTLHTGSDAIPTAHTGSDVIRPTHDHLMENDSDSDSSGHRQLKTKYIKRSKLEINHDFEKPKQIVDHAGIETSNGSLDLSKKDLKHSDVSVTSHEKFPYCDRPSTKPKDDVNIFNVQQITDQIMKSNVQGRNPSSSNGQRFSFTPSFTPEFGNFTKLVREGGNIVYFCQVCNWKSPVKSTFQVHCNTSSHKMKVKSAEDPDSNEQADVNVKTEQGSHKSPNICVSNGLNSSKYIKMETSSWAGAEGSSGLGKVTEGNMFYNYVRQRTMIHKNRTPVVSQYRNGSNDEQAEFLFRRHGDFPMDFAAKKRKRNCMNSLRTLQQRQYTSDSDSDESKSSDRDSQWKNHTMNMALLRNKLLQEACDRKGHPSGQGGKHSQTDNRESNHNSEQVSLDLSQTKSDQVHNSSSPAPNLVLSGEHKDSFVRKRKNGSPALDGEPQEKMSNNMYGEKLRGGPSENAQKARDSSLFKLYKCHACTYEYSSIDEYESHFEQVHKSSLGGLADRVMMGLQQGSECSEALVHSRHDSPKGKQVEPSGTIGNFEMGENWRVQKLKEILPDFLTVNDKGNTSRDFLLQCISLTTGLPDVTLWSSACNKAMREVYPSSLAQRKGKYKKTYYFGVCMVDQYQGQEEVTVTEVDGQVFQSPLRDVNVDMEKIIEHLPSVISWTGCMETGVYRGDILVLLADILQDPDVVNWGAQCNRAIRLVFPLVDMKRKGKFKTTMYFGVSFLKNVQQHFQDKNNRARLMSQFGDISVDRYRRLAENGFPLEDSARDLTLTTPSNRTITSPDFTKEDPSTESEPGNTVYPQWFKNEARSQMDQYLRKFGGVFDEQADDLANGDNNDGDDEEESVESSVTG